MRNDAHSAFRAVRRGDATAAEHRTLVALLVVTVVGQRVALPAPGFELQLTLVTSLLGLAVLVFRRLVVPDLMRLQLYGAAALACCAAAYFAGTVFGGEQSIPSFLVLLALYLPWVFKLPNASLERWGALARAYVRLMLVLSVVAVGQFAVQLAGVWTYVDLLERVLPESLLISGYNVSIPLSYGASQHKSNAFVFLEPSFLSQFCALALLVAVLLRSPLWQLALLALGLFSAVSGTGLFLLAVGGLLTVLRVSQVLRPSMVVAGVFGGVGFLASPYGALLLARRQEFSRQGSSGYDRFVAPYLEVGKGLAQEPLRWLMGAGPGTATRLLESSARGQVGDAVVYNIPSKLVFEYGAVGGTLFTVFILVCLLHRGLLPVLPGAVVFMLFVLSGSLLQPHTVVLAWLLIGLWPRSSQGWLPDRPLELDLDDLDDLEDLDDPDDDDPAPAGGRQQSRVPVGAA